eukprot:8663063-Ditylum_brightwellii.AAC.1
MASASIGTRSSCATTNSIAREEGQLVMKMTVQKASPLLKESVKLIDSGGMKKVEAKNLSRWEEAVSVRHSEFLKKLSASRKEKGR